MCSTKSKLQDKQQWAKLYILSTFKVLMICKKTFTLVQKPFTFWKGYHHDNALLSKLLINQDIAYIHNTCFCLYLLEKIKTSMTIYVHKSQHKYRNEE